MSDSAVVERIISLASKAKQRIVLPESDDPRVLRAAGTITARRYARVVLLGEPERIERNARQLGVDLGGVEIVDHLTDASRAQYVETLYRRRKAKGMGPQDADDLLRDRVFYSGMMVGDGRADGMVCGSVCPTRDTVRSALFGVGLAPDNKTVSGCSVMNTVATEIGADGSFIFADTGVVREPTVEQLSDIAIAAAGACSALLDAEPRIAMLSYSTKGSAHSPAVKKVIDATELVRRRRPDLKVDGELQLDAAVVPDAARRKTDDSPVAGRANTLIFPDLSSGNIAYKIVERLGRGTALGPLLLGLARPVNDLSRACSEDEIVLVTAITAVQAVQSHGIR